MGSQKSKQIIAGDFIDENSIKSEQQFAYHIKCAFAHDVKIKHPPLDIPAFVRKIEEIPLGDFGESTRKMNRLYCEYLDGSSVEHFAIATVLYMGDYYAPGQYPKFKHEFKRISIPDINYVHSGRELELFSYS